MVVLSAHLILVCKVMCNSCLCMISPLHQCLKKCIHHLFVKFAHVPPETRRRIELYNGYLQCLISSCKLSLIDEDACFLMSWFWCLHSPLQRFWLEKNSCCVLNAGQVRWGWNGQCRKCCWRLFSCGNVYLAMAGWCPGSWYGVILKVQRFGFHPDSYTFLGR